MNNNLQQKTARLALLRQTNTLRAVIQKTYQQNGPKSKQRSDLLHKHKHKCTQHNPSTNNNLRACPALFRKDCTPCGASTGQHVSRRDSENEPTNSQNGPKTKQRSELTLKNRFAVLQEPTMSRQDAPGVGKRKGPELETEAFKKKSSLATTSKAIEGYWVRVSKLELVSLEAARATTTKKPINRSQATTVAEGLKRHFRMRLKGTPQGLNLGSIGIQRITSTAYVVRMLFNPDEETMTTGNDNANRYIAGEASVELPKHQPRLRHPAIRARRRFVRTCQGRTLSRWASDRR